MLIIIFLIIIAICFQIKFHQNRHDFDSISYNLKRFCIFLPTKNKHNLYKKLSCKFPKICLKNNYSNKSIYLLKKFQKDFCFVSTFSKFVSYKISKCKKTFRCYNDIPVIDTIAHKCVNEFLSSQKLNIFSNFTHICLNHKIYKKELMFFKILVAKYLVIEIFKINNLLQEVDNVINLYAKKSNMKFKIKNNFLKNAAIYSATNFNPNSNCFEFDKNKKDKSINEFFFELFKLDYTITNIVIYLEEMFM